jgi:O-antigen ligase
MTKNLKQKLSSDNTKHLFWGYLLLAVFLCVLALRATNAETINMPLLSSWTNIGEELTSLIFTALLLVCVLLWFVRIIYQKTFVYSFTALELPAIIFFIAGLIGIIIASNKRAAIDDFVTMVVPVFAAIVLVQILDSDLKIRLVLAVIVALACASAYRCVDQFLTETQLIVDQYKTNPQSILQVMGLTPGTLEAWLAEHRIYTKGVNGFLTTGNSVASFSILAAFAGTALFAEQLKALLKNKSKWLPVLMTAAALVIVLLNFLLVRSKGGTIGLALAFLLFIMLLCFGPFIKKYRMYILIVVLLALIASVAVVVNYGLRHGRLPGGNSMLVRWQYWTGAAEMYADHPVTGVGPGNFVSYYPQYKTPGALETIKDPHNFALAILTQFGPLGLAAFLALLFVPFWRVLNPRIKYSSRIPKKHSSSRALPLIFSLVLAAVLLIVRPVLNPIETTGTPFAGVAYAVAALFVMPAVVFFIGFTLAWAFSHRINLPFTEITVKALFCACIGVYIHNLIDFAVFEPGVYTTLWVIIACLLALNRIKQKRQASMYVSSSPVKIAAIVIIAATVWAFGHYCLIPVAKSTSLLYHARESFDSNLHKTHKLLEEAAEKDTFNPQPQLADATLYLQYIDFYGTEQNEILALAEKSLLAAADRDPADFKPCEKLTVVYKLLAEKSTGDAKNAYLLKSYDAALKAVELYPGMGRLRIKLAEAAEDIGKNDVALENYKKAVEIEDAFRAQFRMMYPDREIISRLGNENYDYARKRIEALQK